MNKLFLLFFIYCGIGKFINKNKKNKFKYCILLVFLKTEFSQPSTINQQNEINETEKIFKIDEAFVESICGRDFVTEFKLQEYLVYISKYP